MPDLTPRPGVDPDDAQAIESAVCALDLYHHTLLKAWYVKRASEPTCLHMARRAAGESRRKRGNFSSSINMAKTLLQAELGRPAVVRKQRASALVRKMLDLDRLTAQPIAD